MIETACAACGKLLIKHKHRFKKHGTHCCNWTCIAVYRRKNNLGPPAVAKSKFYQIQQEYEQKNKTIKRIASKFGCTYSQIQRWAQKYKWVKFQRTTSVRAVYRKLATEKVGRPLIRGEHVHHIDGVITNNVLDNLHVFENARKHSQCHGSLELVAFELYRQGLIGFNSRTGEYFLSS